MVRRGVVRRDPETGTFYRRGRRKVVCHVDPEMHRALRMHIAKHDLSMQDVLERLLTWYVNSGPGSEEHPSVAKFLDYSITVKKQE